MKKFNIDKEISKKQTYINNSNLFIPILVIGCCVLAMVGVSFSYKIIEEDKEMYTIKISIINGETDVYEKEVLEGAFSDTIKGSGTFGSITCSSGSLNYDPFTMTVYNSNVHENTSCVLAFADDGTKNISVFDLESINDNTGTSYYYKGNSENNYFKLNDMNFRILRINGDGTLRLIYDNNDIIGSYGNNIYSNSNLKRILEDWYNNNLKDNKYVVSGDFDTTNYIDYDTNNLINLEGFTISKVGTISVREIAIINKDLDSSYLGSNLLLLNPCGVNNVYAYKENNIREVDRNSEFTIKPVINIDNVELTGSGSKENPYMIKGFFVK